VELGEGVVGAGAAGVDEFSGPQHPASESARIMIATTFIADSFQGE
jgi:hypothetical protein